ncbi:RIP metalloprotease RseP [Pedobacter punctiformis]|uniref:Zinc metalloprotease n=1 Tax=Pedobacter punctiformis TaxID=3004097 RepID=A0ABT4L8Z1_9SPHI|nr:RIP metalloprotease RseP [Pedobacter sp. HCMS5-2]MCZ4244392.1 RIP metalloprotease RseP [Pedobacter sp. HCMS5-2]
MNGLIMAGQLLLGLSLLVILHELGHFLAARAFGIKVEKFYLFFDAWGFKLFSFKKGDVEYGVGWLPLGGYVKIAGMIDESMDTEQMAQPAQPWEFRSKPAWQRLIVMLGGIIVNIIVGIVIFWMLTFKYGETFTPNSAVVNGIQVGKAASEIGLKNGDKILAINGTKVIKFEELKGSKVLMGGTTLTVIRGDKTLEIKVPDNFLDQLKDGKALFVEPRVKNIVDTVLKGSAAEKAGLKIGDKVTNVDGVPVTFQDEVKPVLAKKKGKTASLSIIRAGKPMELTVNVDTTGTIGYLGNFKEIKRTTTNYGFFAALPVGANMAWNTFADNAKGIGKMITGKVSARNISSPIGIAKVYGSTFDWIKFWTLTGLISMALAFMNLLPIPGLDGGHVVFLLIEMIQRKPVSEKVLERAQMVGFVILIGLMIFAFGNDILKSFGK